MYEKINSLLNHDIVICLLLGLFIMTLAGMGDPSVVGIVGLMLCAVGLTRRSAKVDLWILVPLLLYNIFCMASAWAALGNIVDGYASTQMVLPLLYLLIACLDVRELLLLRRLCAAWAGTAAAAGILRFTYQALTTGAGRLGWPLGNPNSVGIFLVLGWFALAGLSAPAEGERKDSRWAAFFSCLEPVILMALALTLSMGSFLSLAAGMLVMVLEKKRHASWRETALYACRILAKATLGVGTGLLLFIAADRTGYAWMCLPVLAYGLAAALCWKSFERFLEAYPRMAAAAAAVGLLVAGAAVIIRPSSIATFRERLEMMRNGLGYLTVDPLLGVGPYQWRYLNLADGDKYFNTWHIHNVLIHIAVESGIPAAAMLLVIVGRFCRKRKQSSEKGALAAFFFHNMLDTGFIIPGIASFFTLITGDPREGGTTLRAGALRLLFGATAAYLAYCLYWYAFLS